jgi:hypothetical protein
VFEALSGQCLPTTAIVESVEQGWFYATPTAADRAVVWLISDSELLFRVRPKGPENI